MQKIKINWNLIICIFLMCVFTCIMFFYINKKEGFHEDEIFSYSASNCKYNSILLTYAKIDNFDTIIKRSSILETLKNRIYYLFNPNEYEQEYAKLEKERSKSIWRSNEDAKETMRIDTISEVLDFFTVYWNTARDVHPPLFYFLVHIVSIISFNTFSKYIIFYINLLFFLATCVILMRIMKILNKEMAMVPVLLFYGMSIGAISTVMFQRMYMMLTFFTVYFLYINLKILYNDFKLDKKIKKELVLVTILGFLTQYYFCIYAAFLCLTMIILMFIYNKKKEIVEYIKRFVVAGIVGLLLFPPAINHIFFSYRGIGGDGSKFSFWEKLVSFYKNIFLAFSIPAKLSIFIIIIFIGIIILEFKNRENRKLFVIFIVPIILNFLVICKLSPYRSLRYIMNILPIIVITFIFACDNLFKNKYMSSVILSIFIVVISICGLKNNNIKYLYIGYNDYLNIAEKYSEDKFVLVCSTLFNHIADMPEFMIYKESLIIEPQNLEELKDDEELKNETEFILSIKNWIGDKEEILNKVLNYTRFSNYELLHYSNKSAQCSVYRIY